MARPECADCGATLREMLVGGRSVLVCPWLRGKMTEERVQPCKWPMNRPRDGHIRREW